MSASTLTRPGPALHARRFTPDPAVPFAFAAVFATVLFLPVLLGDSDTLWQIATGDWIINHGAIPHTDPFSFTFAGRRWFAHEWGAELLMALAHRAAGMAGVAALAAAAAGLAAAIMTHAIRRFVPGIYALLLLVVAFSLCLPSALARPHMLAWPCITAWCAGLVLARSRRAGPPWALLPIVVAWVNLHGSFMLAPALAAVFGAEALLDPGADRLRVGRAWAAFAAAAALLTLLNPDGLEGALFPFHLLRMTSLRWITEWKPTEFSDLHGFEAVLLILLALGFTGRVTLPPVRLLMLLGLVHGSLAHNRHQQLLGLIGVLILAEPLGRSLRHSPAQPSSPRLVPLGAAIAALAFAARLAVPLNPDYTGATLAAALDTLPPSLRAQPVLNGYGFGGPLITMGIRPFIDGRADLYGDDFVNRYHRIDDPDIPELRRTLEEYHIAWTLFPKDEVLVSIMDEMPGWHRVLSNATIVVHARDAPP